VFGYVVDKIAFDKIEFDRIDFDRIEFDRIWNSWHTEHDALPDAPTLSSV
jgi:hypothetical protein